VTNNGKRYERLTITTVLPDVDYDRDDREWMGKTDKGILELLPGENDIFNLTVTTPELKKYWNGKFTISLYSDSKKYYNITEEKGLYKPPISIISFSEEGPFTFEDTLSFIGGQSVWDILEYNYNWNFGDGTNDTGNKVTHSYNRPGEYTVILSILDEHNFTATDSVTIIVTNKAPTASIQTIPLNRTLEVGKPLKLDGSKSQDKDGEIISYYWDFGDFDDGEWPTIEHTYDKRGVYFVTLFVTDNSGTVGNLTVTIEVIPASVDPEPDTTPTKVEKKTTAPLSFLPGVLTVLVLVAGALMIVRKKDLIKVMKDKISEEQEKMGKK